MRPINQDERRKAFWNFFILFIVTIIVVTTTVFFSVQIPFKQNEELRKYQSTVEKEHTFSDNFMNKMGHINVLLDSTKSTKQPELLDATISEEITALQRTVPDSIYNRTLYQNVLFTLNELKDAKSGLVAQSGKNIGEDVLRGQIVTMDGQLRMSRDSVKNLVGIITKLQGHYP